MSRRMVPAFSRCLHAGLLSILSIATPSLAAQPTSESYVQLGAVSDYVWRGISHTEEGDIALQGEARYRHASGLYIGAFGTTLDRAFYPQAGNAAVRGDFFAGVELQSATGLGADLGVIATRFNKSRLGFEEAYLGLSFGLLRAQVFHDWDNDNTYARAGVDMDLGSGLRFQAHGGHYRGDTVASYNDYGAGISTVVSGWILGLAVTDTDIRPETNNTNTHGVISIQRRW